MNNPGMIQTIKKGDFSLGVSGFRYSDLFEPEGLKRLTEAFYAFLASRDEKLASQFAKYREIEGRKMSRRNRAEAFAEAGEGGHQFRRNASEGEWNKVAESDLLIRVAQVQSSFLAGLFQIEEAQNQSLAEHQKQNPVFQFKREVVVRLSKKYKAQAKTLIPPDIFAVIEKVRPDLKTLLSRDPELAVATAASELLDLSEIYRKHLDPRQDSPLPGAAEKRSLEIARISADSAATGESSAPQKILDALQALLEQFAQWAAVAVNQREHEGKYYDWVSLQFPETLDLPDGLVKAGRPNPELPNLIEFPKDRLRLRDGFKLTDPRGNLRFVLDQTHYCVICHEREKDSCSKGLPLPRQDKPLQKNALGATLTGCPLDERISEMHLLKRKGDTIAALAMVMIDNPMCPATGHRICNDCMKGCIYQKQEPVNIPQIETRALTDVLNLPWGVEIYGLLTRWNPINVRRPHALPYHGKNVLIVGLGPAGFCLSQYLLNQGFGIVGIEGLKVEPLPAEWIGDENTLPKPVKNFREIYDELDERVSLGFGGVAEYGITIRWDKNFLKLIYLTLMRRKNFRVYGGIRFGGTLTAEDAWNFGFHHIGISAGAGRPSLLNIKNNLISGIRQASDFLMALQNTGAFKKFSVANLQLRLPAIVIGGGLTGIDTATESLAYYPVQVEKMLERYEKLAAEFGEEKVRALFADWEKEILEEQLQHGRAIREERAKAAREGRKPNLVALCKKWGGVTLVYRKRMQEAPAYRLNHEEVNQALSEGITYGESLEPREAVPDEHGWLKAMVFERMTEEGGKWIGSGELVTLPAKTVLVAAGTIPNTGYESEHSGTLKLDSRGKFFQGHKIVDGKLVPAEQTRENHGFFTSYEKEGKYISFYGDNHPVYAGSVVKAVASAKYGAEAVAGLFAPETQNLNPDRQSEREEAWRKFCQTLDDQIKATVTEVRRLTPTITEVIVRAPLQARKFEPGQFYRLQNYETKSLVLGGTKLQMEGVALTGAWVDKKEGLLSMIALEMGVSSRLCAFLKKGEEVVAMGPTGTPSEIGKNENVVLCGGGLGNAVLFSIAKRMKEAGNRVVYFAGYKKPEDLFHREDIESACDQVIWSVDAGTPIQAQRPQDRSFVGNIVQSLLAYAGGEQGNPLFPMEKADRILAIGSDRMMAAVKQARFAALKEYFDHPHAAIASINSPMQCMMKEICAQCLQRHVNPKTGKETYVFSCYNQDQKMDWVDWKHLNERLRQNTVQEKLSNLWLDYLLLKNPVPHV